MKNLVLHIVTTVFALSIGNILSEDAAHARNQPLRWQDCMKLPMNRGRSECLRAARNNDQANQNRSTASQSYSAQPTQPSKPVDESKNGIGIVEGANVECNWKGGGAYYPGVVKTLSGDKVDIDYNDGDKEEQVDVKKCHLKAAE